MNERGLYNNSPQDWLQVKFSRNIVLFRNSMLWTL